MLIRQANSKLGTQLTLDQIADKCHVSKFHLCHLFRQELGITVMQYITKQRILLAKSALLETDKAISLIAMDNGFMNFSHFSSAFRLSEGISPTEFRRIHRTTPPI
ncbi:MAG: helix-turn-helix transcriptional regulator [Clostridia bacterium]|nr:helix-turn-helix transcriptional regulator [Clostridia bacterium]